MLMLCNAECINPWLPSVASPGIFHFCLFLAVSSTMSLSLLVFTTDVVWSQSVCASEWAGMFVFMTPVSQAPEITTWVHSCMSRFFLRKINWSIWSCLRTLRCAETISPAVLKTLSDATLVAGIQRYLLARDESSGRSDCLFHHCSGSSLRGTGSYSLYLMTSSLALFARDGLLVALFTSKVPPNSRSSAAPFPFFLQGGWSSEKTIPQVSMMVCFLPLFHRKCF